jgi:hypothetical protein
MPKITFDTSGKENLEARMRTTPEKWRSALRITFDNFAREARRRIADKLSGPSLQPRTGRLRSSFQVVPAAWKGDTLSASVVHDGGDTRLYGLAHELGTDPYQIFAVKARALRFLAAGREQYVFRQSVRHPAQPAKHFVEDTAREIEAPFRETLRLVIRRLFGK